MLPREPVAEIHRLLGRILDGDTADQSDTAFDEALAIARPSARSGASWTPPPPGDRREQLPDDILAMLAPRIYLSTACEMAEACERAVLRHPDRKTDLMSWATWLHSTRCRLNNKFSGRLCVCPCHPKQTPTEAT